MSQMKLTSVYNKVKENISRVIVGKDEVIDLLLVTMFARGHILLEDVPGTGKTMLVKSLASSVDCTSSRIQFTPDLLPSDVTGINFYNMKSGEFEFVKGPVFAGMVLADEINRATPKTQSGLLECMEERQVTVDGTTYPMEELFMVIATQNPVENMGVFPLPEAQLDRFLVKTAMGYPDHNQTVMIMERFASENPLEALAPVVSVSDVIEAQKELDGIQLDRDIASYIVSITESTRHVRGVELGASPRAALALMRVARGYAAINGRQYVIPDDVKRAAIPTLAHRLVLSGAMRIRKNAAQEIISEIISTLTVPTESQLS